MNSTIPYNDGLAIMRNGSPVEGLTLHKFSVESIVMSLGDKITGDVFYKDNTLQVTGQEYVEYDGVKYVIVSPPTVVREGMAADNGELKGMTKYSFVFYHPMYMLGNFPFTDIAVNQEQEKYLSQNKTFSWIGTLLEYIAKVDANLSSTEWKIALSSSVTQEKQNEMSDVLQFDKQFISDALKKGYETWNIPFVITTIKPNEQYYNQGKRFLITFGLPTQEIYSVNEQGQITSTPYIFRFGKGVGLKNNSRTPRNNKIITRIVGYGSERNVPFGYPQIVWTGNQNWDYTINNASGMQTITVGGHTIQAMSYPIYDGIVGGQKVRLIKHPFTRSTLMPSIYTDTVNKKVNPNATGYNPSIEIKDYYDAIDDSSHQYPNNINVMSPSVEVHQFENVYPRLNENTALVNVYPYEDSFETISLSAYNARILAFRNNSNNYKEKEALLYCFENLAYIDSASEIGGSYTYEYTRLREQTYQYGVWYHIKYTSANVNFEYIVWDGTQAPQSDIVWDDTYDSENDKYVQEYFKIKLPVLNFDIYACAAVTQEMKINMRSGDCLGCTFPVQVDWDDYKRNFYDQNGNFDPVIGQGHPRDGEKYPNSSQQQVTLIVQKDKDTFGTLMPNTYQKPQSGDKFVVLGISLPTSYITSAEVELDNDMKEYMLENNVHYYDYPLKFDEYFLTTHSQILEQIQNNNIVRFQYSNGQMALYIKQITIKYGERPLPQYDITLTDDVEIVLNKIGQVTDDVSRMQLQLSELQKYYSENLIQEISNKLSRIQDDVCQGRITFQQGLDAIGSVIFHDEIRSPQFETGLYDGQGWRIDNLGNAEFESARVRSYLEVVELLVNRMRAQEGDTMFTDNDQIDHVEPVYSQYTPSQGANPSGINLYERELVNNQYVYTKTTDTTVVSSKTYFRITAYKLSLKEKYDGYITSQMYGNILRGIINTLAAKQAGISDETSKSVEVDGENKYYTSWMRVIETWNTPNSTLGVNQILVELYSDDYDVEDPQTHETVTQHFTPAGVNFPPCELMTIARWGCYLDPEDEGISQEEKESRERRQRMFMISVTDGRVVKYTKVNSPILEQWNYGVTIGELPQFVKDYPDVRKVLNQVGEHTDWLYAQGIVVGNFIKVDINGKPEVTIVDCGEWVDGSQVEQPTFRNGVYLNQGWNNISQQYETHDVWHNNARWRCLISQPVVQDNIETYYEPTTQNARYWRKIQSSVEGQNGTSGVSVYKWHNSGSTPPQISGTAYPPTGWYISAPSRPTSGDNIYLWMSNGNLSPDTGQVDAWSTPVHINGEDGYSVQAQYSPDTTTIHTTWQSGDIYMRTKQSNETNWSSWQKMVGDNGGETSYTYNISKSLTTTNATTAPSNCYYQQWQNLPILPTGTYPYLWVKVVKRTWNSSTQAYVDGTPSYIRMTGEQGTSPYFADLDNEMDSVQCNQDGYITRSQTIETTISLWKGSESVQYTIGDIYRNSVQMNWDSNNDNVWPRFTNGKVYIEYDVNSSIIDDKDDIKITLHLASDSSVTKELHLTINGVRSSAIYRLVPSHSQIVKKQDGTYIPSVNITCAVNKIEDGAISTPSASEYTLEKSVNGGSYVTYSATSPSTITSDLKFRLTVGGVVVDLETIPLVKDGTNGTDGNDGVSYSIVFSTAYAKADQDGRISGRLAGHAYKNEGGTLSVLPNTTIRYGYIIDDSDTYGQMTTDSNGFFDTLSWFDGDYIDDYNSPSIFAAIIIDNVVCVETITISIKGETGVRGKTGRFYYYAQEWQNTSSVSYLVTDAEAPYFSYNNQYWVFNPEENYPNGISMSAMGAPSSSSSNWEIMTSDFKYIITEAIFGKYAHFGRFIINEDWMFSTNGKVDNEDYNNDANISGNIVGGSTFDVKAYTLFDATNPLGESILVSSGDTDILISSGENTKTIKRAYLTTARTYRITATGYKNGQTPLYLRIRNDNGDTLNVVSFTTASSTYEYFFRVATNATYTMELYQPSLGASGVLKSYELVRVSFAPNYAVDGLTGKSYQNDGYFKGVIHATGGVFNGTVYANNGVFNGTIRAGLFFGNTKTVTVGTYQINPIEEPFTTFLYNEYVGNKTIKLPSASNYDGLEITIFIKSTSPYDLTNNGIVVSIEDNSQDSIYIQQNIGHFTDTASRQQDVQILQEQYYGVQNCLLLANIPYVFKSMLGSWYAIKGVFTGE